MFGRERIRIQNRRDVAAATRIGIVQPGAPHIGRLFQDRERIDPRLLQADRQTQAADPGTHNHDPGKFRTITRLHEFPVGRFTASDFHQEDSGLP